MITEAARFGDEEQQDHFARGWLAGREPVAQLDRVARAELRMKLTGLPAETVCREAMLGIAQVARSGTIMERLTTRL